MRVVIATRKSPLALWQAEHVRGRLLAVHPAMSVELLGLTTEGDRQLGVALSSVGGKGLFVKELEQAMLDGTAHLAVHSMKDVPADLPDGFTLAAILERADPRDVLVSNAGYTLGSLPQGARVGTSSLRRRTQLLAQRPDLQLVQVRGNVGTRLSRLQDAADELRVDALVLARAGLDRLGLTQVPAHTLSVTQCLPAGGQGALGIEVLSSNTALIAQVAPLSDAQTMRCVQAEREVSRLLGAGCTMPLGAFAQQDDTGAITLHACLADASGKTIIRAEATDAAPQLVGALVAEQLLRQGAREMIAALSIAAATSATRGT